MDKLLETLNKIRSLFNLDEIKQEVQSPEQPQAPAAVKYGTETLADGTIISWEGDGPLAVGVVVYKDVEGTLTPLEDGKYPLQSGMILVISGGEGKCTEILEQEESPNEETPAPVEESKSEIETLKAEIEELKAEIKDLKDAISKFSTVEKTLNSRIEKLAKAPDGEPLAQKIEKTSPLTEMDRRLNSLDKLRLSR